MNGNDYLVAQEKFEADPEFLVHIFKQAIKKFSLVKGQFIIYFGHLNQNIYDEMIRNGFTCSVICYDDLNFQYELMIMDDREQLMLFKLLYNELIFCVEEVR